MISLAAEWECMICKNDVGVSPSQAGIRMKDIHCQEEVRGRRDRKQQREINKHLENR
jgi:hypothetical protein